MGEGKPIRIEIKIDEIDNGFLVYAETEEEGYTKFFSENLHQVANQIDKILTKYVSYYLKFKKEE